MKISELSRKSGIPASAIRFYERSGLLPSAHRESNGYRVYGEETIELLRRITLGQALGFSLDTLRSAYGSADGLSKEDMLAHLDRRLDEIDALQADLKAQSKNLRALRDKVMTTWQQGICMATPSAVKDLADAISDPTPGAKRGDAARRAASARKGAGTN